MKEFIVNNLQEIINKGYDEFGLTDEIYELQVKLNKYKNKHNVNSEDELIYEKYTQ